MSTPIVMVTVLRVNWQKYNYLVFPGRHWSSPEVDRVIDIYCEKSNKINRETFLTRNVKRVCLDVTPIKLLKAQFLKTFSSLIWLNNHMMFNVPSYSYLFATSFIYQVLYVLKRSKLPLFIHLLWQGKLTLNYI